jgi:hypothetical protein
VVTTNVSFGVVVVATIRPQLQWQSSASGGITLRYYTGIIALIIAARDPRLGSSHLASLVLRCLIS